MEHKFINSGLDFDDVYDGNGEWVDCGKTKICTKCGLWITEKHEVIERSSYLIYGFKWINGKIRKYKSSEVSCALYAHRSHNVRLKLAGLNHDWNKNTPSVILMCSKCDLEIWYGYDQCWIDSIKKEHFENKNCDEIIMEKVLT